MTDNADVIRNLYAAFQKRDYQGMAACYGPNAKFHDPVFTDLSGVEIGAMWRMLCERASDLELNANQIVVDGEQGSAHWEARYTFSATGHRVHNVIDATFTFAGGRIQRHVDRFNLYRWARQALGLKGLLLGWTPPVQSAIRVQAMRGLDSFMRQNGIGA